MNVYKDTINELSIELDKKSRLIQKQQLMLKVRKKFEEITALFTPIDFKTSNINRPMSL